MMRTAVVALTLALIAPFALAAEEFVIDDFEYATVEMARDAWIPDERSLPVDIMQRNGSTALQLNADFTGESNRAVYDRDVDLDLSRWGRFSLDMYVADPGLFRSFTIYFRSGDGWYGNGLGIGRAGWNTIDFSRSGFRAEGNPAGWDQIDGIRLSAWRGAHGIGSLAVDNFVAYREPYVVVMGTNTVRAGGGEARAVQSAADTVSQMLADAGLMTSTIGDEDVAAGALEDFDFAIFAYNPDMTEDEVESIARYIQGGGRIMAFYAIPDSLARLMGVNLSDYMRAEYPGQFSEIRFEHADEFVGIPETVMQTSWNIRAPEAIEGESRVIGWWYDDAGENTGYPAFIASDAGIYMSHILLSTDRHTKGRMLVAMMARYLPEVWPGVARAALDGPEQIAHVHGVDAVHEWIDSRVAAAPDPAALIAALAQHHARLAEAHQTMEAEDYPRTIDLAGQAWDHLREAWLLAQRPRSGEFRAWWEHAGTGAFDTWEESMRNLAENGFNAIVPNMLWGGLALYESEYVPHHRVVAERGDQIAECVEAAKRYGIEVHPWKVNWRVGNAPEEFVQQMRDEGRLQQSFGGEEMAWLCPSDPRNLRLEIDTMVEMARNYDVDGVHFDYIRYPGPESCFCAGCEERFQRDTGIQVRDWPADLRSDELRDAWTQWRCDQISRLVEGTAHEVRAIKPHVKISAAVFPNYPGTRASIGQDWVYWIEQGWLDFVCPMNYTNSDITFATTVATQMGHVAGRVPLYPGIGATASHSTLSVDRVAGQAQIARHLGADGFIVFNYARDQALNTVPGLGRALLAEPALHPHNAPRFVFELAGDPTRERTFGLHVAPGAIVSATVTRAEVIEGREFGEVTARIVLQDVDGHTVADLAEAPGPGDDPVAVQFTAPEGLHRLAVVGSYTDRAGEACEFVTRSLPVVAGDIAPDVAELL
jgi:uncharacterized lipoprotein YddW (UPF0748 family)